jgi:hypothetical protein
MTRRTFAVDPSQRRLEAAIRQFAEALDKDLFAGKLRIAEGVKFRWLPEFSPNLGTCYPSDRVIALHRDLIAETSRSRR